MPYRKNAFFAGQFYHLFNRVVKGNLLFTSWDDYSMFLNLIRKRISNYPFEMVCYCLMPTHYHFFVKILQTGHSISKFISVLLNAYVRRLQIRGNASVRFFPGRFKHVHVERTEQFLHLIRYIHLNPVKAGLVRHPMDWPYSNYREFATPGSKGPRGLLTPEEYEDFVMDPAVGDPKNFNRFKLD